MINIAVLASTNGTDLQAIIDAIKAKTLDVNLKLVFANKECYAIERAKEQGFNTKIELFKKDVDTRESYDKKVAAILDEENVDLIVLVGYMRLFSPWFVQKYENKIINVHPSLLPAFPGMDLSVHEEVIKAGCKVSGCTIHFVDEGCDSGPIIVQKEVAVAVDETPQSLKKKVQEEEKKLYVRVIQQFSEGKITITDREVKIE